MSRDLRPLAALAIVALIGAGCSDASSENGDAGTEKATGRDKAVRFAQCMRQNGVGAFPDPDASGELTIDAIANRSPVNTSTAAFKQAISTCKDLEPPGFRGRKRSAQEQEHALEFAQCMRDNGIKDFPDPVEGGPLIDTRRIPSAAGRGGRDIPGFDAAAQKCTGIYSGELGLQGQ